MIFLIVFLSLWIGLLCKTNFIIFIPLLFLFLIFVRHRFSKKLFFLSLLISSVGIGISFISISTDRENIKGAVIESKENYYILDSFGERFYIYEKNNNKDKLTGIETGFYDLDGITNGLQKSDLIILAARPAMGKTSFALNIAQNVALRAKVPVAIF